jgi:AAA domain
MTLLAWSEALPEWQRDALRRIAVSDYLSDDDRAAIRARLLHAGGVGQQGDVACTPLTQTDLPTRIGAEPSTILCGIGPVQHVDKLANDQELRCAINGITLNFGDNGAGKSGYARVAKQLCLARVVDELQGDVFAPQSTPPAQVRYRYRLPGDEEPEAGDWVDGQPRPSELAQMMVLDTANTRVYVDGRNEITYLPREIEIVARFGRVCTDLAEGFQRDADASGQRCRGPYGAAYDAASTAGRMVRALVIETPLAGVPSETAMRQAADWNDLKRDELDALELVLAHNTVARAATLRRQERTLTALANELEVATASLSDGRIEAARGQIASAVETAQAAMLSAQDRFADGSVRGTGEGVWGTLYRLARQFAADSGVRTIDEPMAVGDPCPYCQREINEETAARLRRFDDYVQSAAAVAAAAATAALSATEMELEALHISDADAINRAIGEYRNLGTIEAAASQDIATYAAALLTRKAAALAGVRDRALPELARLPNSAVATLRAEAARMTNEAQAFEAEPVRGAETVARAVELRDARRLSVELDAVLARRADIEMRQRLLTCKNGLDTRHISQCATRLRRELVTPELQGGIADELDALGLGEVPFRFDEASDRGRNYFDMALDAPRPASKARVLSEGEQRALGIACFFAEMKRVPGTHGIIVDDPVSSLDHQRLRKVAERLVSEAAASRQVVIFTHHLVFYQEVIAAAAANTPQVPVLVNLISKRDGRFGVISEDDEPWIAKKVVKRIEELRGRVASIPANIDRTTDDYRRRAKDFYTDLRETWERFVEEVLLCGVVERFTSGVKTQSLRDLSIEDADYQVIYAAMSRVSEYSGHDMAAGRQIPVPDLNDLRRDLETLDLFRVQIHQRKAETNARRAALQTPPQGQVA